MPPEMGQSFRNPRNLTCRCPRMCGSVENAASTDCSPWRSVLRLGHQPAAGRLRGKATREEPQRVREITPGDHDG